MLNLTGPNDPFETIESPRDEQLVFAILEAGATGRSVRDILSDSTIETTDEEIENIAAALRTHGYTIAAKEC